MDDHLERFRQAWSSEDDPPEIAAFLPEIGSKDRRSILQQLICIDMEQRWQDDGQDLATHRSLEDYAASWPELQLSGDMILHEFRLRQSRGETPTVDDYLQRFPELSHELTQQLSPDAAELPDSQPVVVEPRDESTRMPKTAQVSTPEAIPATQVIRTIGQYQLIRQLGQGGMGTVYHARHTRLHKDVALKVLRGHETASADQIARFEREMRAVGQLDHPNVVRALDAGEVDGVCFLSMELINGVELSRIVAEQPLLSIADACEVARQAALGLQYAHDQGLVHRDVKPSNLMLAVDATGSVSVRLLDLGLARIAVDGAEPERLTDEGQAMGTLQYMAPEQADDTHSVDHRADIYALGVTLYRMLTGTVPFSDSHGSSLAAYLRALTSSEAPGVATRRAEVPSSLATTIDSMLARSADQRPQSLNDVIIVLEPFCSEHRLAALVSSIRGRLKTEASFASIDGSSPRPAGIRPTPNDRGRIGILLERVRRFWVDGVLQRSVQDSPLLTLRKSLQPEAVRSPWEGVTELPVEGTESDQDIVELFDGANQSLLILGTAGAGKTTALLQLTSELVRRAERDPRQPVPVVLHLSSWVDPAVPLKEWIADELSAKYQIPRSLGLQWLEQERLILLLDGLDEVSRNLQSACINALNRFLDESPETGIAVCSRADDYEMAAGRLQLETAVCLQPLRPEQIFDSINDSRTEHRALDGALRNHNALLDLARSPLMLSILKLNYQDSSGDSSVSALTGSAEAARRRLFDSYIDRMFRRKGENGPWSREQTMTWIGWLARRMQGRRQSLFLIEELQPDWLTSRAQLAVYAVILSVLLGLGTALTTAFFWINAVSTMDLAARTPRQSLLWLLVQTPVWYLAVVALDFTLLRRLGRGMKPRPVILLQGACKSLIYWLLWMIWPLTAWLTGTWPTGWIISNVLIGVLTGAFLGIWGSRRRVAADVKPVEALGVTAVGSLRGWLWGLLVGYAYYQTYLWLWAHFLLEEPPEWFPFYWQHPEELFVSIAYPALAGSIGLVIGGLQPRIVRGKTVPNQGMKMSARNALIAAAFSSVVVLPTIMVALQSWLLLPENDYTQTGWESIMTSVGFTVWASFHVALWFGALDLLKHVIIRVILVATGQTPVDLTGFLDHAVRLNLLQRVGGAWIFSHRLLLDHCAETDDLTR